MNKETFWIFGHLGLGDHIVCNALYRHFSALHSSKFVIIPVWEYNLASVQWLLSDCKNVFFYPVHNEQQIYTCMLQLEKEKDYISLGFYNQRCHVISEAGRIKQYFNPVEWDSEFYRQANLDPELKWKGFKLPEIFSPKEEFLHVITRPLNVVHQDDERGFLIKDDLKPNNPQLMTRLQSLKQSCQSLYMADEIHCIDSSMLNLADLMETPDCKRFVFHRYARKGLPPQLRKPWEIIG